MSMVNVHEAKTHLSRILERVASGEQVVIARNGKPVAMLVPVGQSPRSPGRLKGKLKLKPDFDDPLPEPLAQAFRGESP